MKSLRYLDLSDNQIKGSIPNWLGEIGGNSLLYLNLSHNSITGLPDHELQWNVLLFLILTSNLIQGSFPPSICNLSNIRVLDMSNNFFSGVIPQCFGNLSHSLEVVNLGNNNFQGTIPDLYKNCALLFGIMLNGNQLQGEVSSSFSRCQSLQILDLGNNNLTGTFPTWLGDLPQLQVLDLRSNKFHGTIESSSTVELPFPSLRVLDLSQNAFVGNLPRFLGTLKAMQKKSTKLEYLQLVGLYYYSVTLMVKDALVSFPKISVAYTVVDLSNNMFEYVIPDSIGSLASLIVLNLSHNSLIGHIPDALGNLSEIESLDISWNQLTGEIPQSLADLKFLSVLNLSQNHLMGRIPRGSQFDTFQGSSFGGNSELCGSQVPRNCDGPTPPTLQHEEADDDEGIMSGFTWKVVMIGYGGGTLFGLLIGHLMFLTRKPKWFNAMVDEQELRIRRRHDVRYIHIGK